MKPINISALIKKYGPGYFAKNKKTGRVVTLDNCFSSIPVRKIVCVFKTIYLMSGGGFLLTQQSS